MKPITLVPDNKLIKGCLAGRKSAFNGLYERYVPTMLGVCARYAKNKDDAEDIMQEGFVKVFTHLRQFRKEGSLEGWIRKIMVRTALQWYRNKMELYVVSEMEATNELSTDYDSASQIANGELLKMVQELPPAYRMVFNLFVIEGYAHKEIAEMLGVTEGTSKSNLSDARRLLKAAINKSATVARKKHA